MSKLKLEKEWPKIGEGYTNKNGIKAYLDLSKSYTRPKGRVRYTFVIKAPQNFFIDHPGSLNQAEKEKWWSMPAGFYLITSEEDKDIYIKWWIK